MPNRDGTGPNGEGPLTGLGLGPCSENRTGLGFRRGRGFKRGKGFGAGQGMGRGLGRGLGTRCPFYNREPTKEEEKEYLQKELKAIEEKKKEIEKALNDLE